MFEQEDPKFWKGERLNFEDKGPPTKGATSHKYAVYRKPGTLLGYVKWQAFQYQLFPLNTYLKRFELREIAQFCEDRTKGQLADSVLRRIEYRKKRHIPGPLPKLLREKLERLQQSENAAGGGGISA